MCGVAFARLRVAAVAGSLMLGGCTAPEDENPVALQPGLYEVVVGGGTLIESRSGKTVDQVCIREAQAAYFPTDPLAPIVKPWSSCSTTLNNPKGNALSGLRECRARKMPMAATYSGSHTTDTFKIEGLVKQGSLEGGSVMHLGSGEFHITGKRIGDCPF